MWARNIGQPVTYRVSMLLILQHFLKCWEHVSVIGSSWLMCVLSLRSSIPRLVGGHSEPSPGGSAHLLRQGKLHSNYVNTRLSTTRMPYRYTFMQKIIAFAMTCSVNCHSDSLIVFFYCIKNLMLRFCWPSVDFFCILPQITDTILFRRHLCNGTIVE
jgi:hypothetical protein